jgi:hypothetical protein
MKRGGSVSDPLWLDREAMRRLGHRVVEVLGGHLDDPMRRAVHERLARRAP